MLDDLNAGVELAAVGGSLRGAFRERAVVEVGGCRLGLCEVVCGLGFGLVFGRVMI